MIDVPLQPAAPEEMKQTQGKNLRMILGVCAAFLIILLNFFVNTTGDKPHESALDANQVGIEALQRGDEQAAIQAFREAADKAMSKEHKINALKNLAYAYEAEDLLTEAHAAYTEALALADTDSFDEHLIFAERAMLDGDMDAAFASYMKAYEKNPKDFQINNSLALFYLNLSEDAPQYEDYPKALVHAKKAYDFDEEKLMSTKENLAIAYFFNDQYQEAITLLGDLNFSQRPYAAFWLGVSYLGIDNDEEGRRYLQLASDYGVALPENLQEYLVAE